MPISGNLRTMRFPDLLQWISMSRKTGTLLVKGTRFTKRVFFDEGKVSAVASDDPRERLGHYLVGWGVLDTTQLQELLDAQDQRGKALGELVVEAGHASSEEMARLARFTAEEILFDLMLWEEGEFRFVDDNLPSRQYRHLELSVDHFLFEGARRLDEMRRIRERVPDHLHVPHRLAAVPDDVPGPARAIVESIDGERSIEEIALICRVSEFDVASVVYRGLGAGYLELLPPAEVVAEEEQLSWQDFFREAETSLSLGDYLEAYQHVMTARQSFASVREVNERALDLIGRIQEELQRSPVSREVILELAVDFKHLTTLHCSPEEAFILSRINGRYTLPQILALFPGEKLLGRVLIHSLLQQGIVKYRESQAVQRFRKPGV